MSYRVNTDSRHENKPVKIRYAAGNSQQPLDEEGPVDPPHHRVRNSATRGRGEKNADTPILRYDNHHGVHERHEGEDVEEIEFLGHEELLRRFARELPDEVSP